MDDNREVCPFCKEPITTAYFWKDKVWSCGCFNNGCKIRPKTKCKDTKEEAINEWYNAYVK